MGARKVVERSLWHDSHSAAQRVRGLCHRVDGAIPAHGDHGSAGGERLGGSPVRDDGQFIGAGEQDIAAPSGQPQRGFYHFAFGFCVIAARSGIDDELKCRCGVYVWAVVHMA